MSGKAVHVYKLSRLVHASPAQWEKILRDLEENKDRAYSYYYPARESIVRLCANPKNKQQIVADLQVAAQRVPHGKGQYPVRDNLRAFECFESKFLPQIEHFVTHYLRSERGGGVSFEGIFVTGLPHMAVLDGSGSKKYVFLYPSVWEKRDLDAYLELLSVIVHSKFHGDDASLWCMNLRTGRSVQHKSSARLRKRCESAARLYSRLSKADTTP
jgi:hypothetical protein